jgi:O-antigen ligase
MFGAFVVAGLQISRDALTRTSWMREQIGGQTFERMNLNRLNGNFGSPTYVALLMAVLILICLNFLYTRYSIWLKLTACAAVGVFFYVFMKANSRAAPALGSRPP